MATRAELSEKFPDFLTGSADEVAPMLLGCVLERELDGRKVQVRIVETEGYDQNDEASHTFKGKSKRNSTMFGPPGHLYVYFTYGMHHCCNIVTGSDGFGSGVLIRAVEPIGDASYIEERRRVTGVNATNGPGKLTQALDINLDMNGHDLRKSPLKLFVGELRPGEEVASSPRIGISRAVDLHRRYYIRGNTYVTRHKHGY